MAAMQTTMIRARITAYSTAVGPSSRLRNSTTQRPRLAMVLFSFGSTKGKPTWERRCSPRNQSRGKGIARGRRSPSDDYVKSRRAGEGTDKDEQEFGGGSSSMYCFDGRFHGSSYANRL